MLSPRGEHAVEAQAPFVVGFHDTGTPALPASVLRKAGEGLTHAQPGHAVGAIAAVDLPAREEHAFGVHRGHDPARRARRPGLLREVPEMPEAGPAVGHRAARALEPLDAREGSPHGLGLELPGGAVALRLQEQAVERRLEGDADPQVLGDVQEPSMKPALCRPTTQVNSTGTPAARAASAPASARSKLSLPRIASWLSRGPSTLILSRLRRRTVSIFLGTSIPLELSFTSTPRSTSRSTISSTCRCASASPPSRFVRRIPSA